MSDETMDRTVALSKETIRWIESAVKDYDPLYATTAENTPQKLVCWTLWCQLQRDPYDRLAQTLEAFHPVSDDELPGMWSRSDFTGGETDGRVDVTVTNDPSYYGVPESEVDAVAIIAQRFQAAMMENDWLCNSTVSHEAGTCLGCITAALTVSLGPTPRVAELPFDPWCPYCGADSTVSGCVEGECRG